MADVEISTIITQGVAASRPAAADALEYYATDTRRRYWSNGSAWSEQIAPGTELDYVEFTSSVNVTATTEGTSNAIVTGSSVAYNGSTVVLIQFFAPDVTAQPTANAFCILLLYEDSTLLGWFGQVRTPAASGFHVPVFAARRRTPSNASHTYTVKAYTSSGTSIVNGGTGGTGTFLAGYIRITKV